MVKEFQLEKKIDWGNEDGDLDMGRYCCIIPSANLQNYDNNLRQIYPEKKDITFKIFKEVGKWGDKPMFGSVVAQNLYHSIGAAPKVWDVVMVDDGEKKYMAQITEYMNGKRGSEREMKKFFEMIRGWADEQKWEIRMRQDIIAGNLIDDQWVDFQDFEPLDGTKDTIIDKLHKVAHWQKAAGEISYQDIPGLVEGKRKIGRVDHQLYEGKTVLDIGCSGGAETISAEMSGATRVYAVDTPEVARVAEQAAALIGSSNIDFMSYNLADEGFYDFITKRTKRKTFDVILFLSMHMHIRFPKYVSKLMHKDTLLIFEGNRDLDNERYEKDMGNAGLAIKRMGSSHDLGARTIWHAQKFDWKEEWKI